MARANSSVFPPMVSRHRKRDGKEEEKKNKKPFNVLTF